MIDDTFTNLINEGGDNKVLLSLVNDFEDGKWRTKKFENFIWDNITETALSKKEKDSLINNPQTMLFESANRLQLSDDKDKDGEIGEIVLYGIMRKYYSALPVVPKIFYKQNRNDPAKGVDSIHITINKDGNFSVWLGEAKFYNSIYDSRFDDIVESINNIFIRDKLRKEFNIVTSIGELDSFINDEKLLKEIKLKLSNGMSLDEIKKHLHIPILILHECKITKNNVEGFEDYKKKIEELHIQKFKSFIEKQDDKLKDIFKISDVHFHLILFPIPNKKEIVERFNQKARFERDE